MKEALEAGFPKPTTPCPQRDLNTQTVELGALERGDRSQLEHALVTAREGVDCSTRFLVDVERKIRENSGEKGNGKLVGGLKVSVAVVLRAGSAVEQKGQPKNRTWMLSRLALASKRLLLLENNVWGTESF